MGHQVELVTCRDHPSAPRRYASLLAATLAAAWRSRRRTPTVVEAHIAYPTAVFALPLAAVRRAPLVLFAHGSDVLQLPGRSRVDRALCRFAFGRAALVVANSAFLAAEVEDRLGVRPERIVQVSPGIRYAEFAAARDSAAARDGSAAARDGSAAARDGSAAARDAVDPPRAYALLFVANLIRRKGLDLLIAALAVLAARGEHVPPLRVVGDGPERAALEQQARAAGVTVEFVGALPQDAVAREMAASELLVVPSREEALGLAPLEAMAAGCVPLVSGLGGLAESVVDGVNGFTCRPEDPGDLADALVRARTALGDPRARAQILRAGDEVARQHDVDAAAARTIEWYAGLVTEGADHGHGRASGSAAGSTTVSR